MTNESNGVQVDRRFLFPNHEYLIIIDQNTKATHEHNYSFNIWLGPNSSGTLSMGNNQANWTVDSSVHSGYSANSILQLDFISPDVNFYQFNQSAGGFFNSDPVSDSGCFATNFVASPVCAYSITESAVATSPKADKGSISAAS